MPDINKCFISSFAPPFYMHYTGNGKNGILSAIEVTIPEYAQPGDIFYFDICNTSNHKSCITFSSSDTVIYEGNDTLERILTHELGDSDDYKHEYGDTPFGLLVRKIAKLDHDSAMAAFSAFINDESLNQKQIEFILKIINNIENNGYI